MNTYFEKFKDIKKIDINLSPKEQFLSRYSLIKLSDFKLNKEYFNENRDWVPTLELLYDVSKSYNKNEITDDTLHKIFDLRNGKEYSLRFHLDFCSLIDRIEIEYQMKSESIKKNIRYVKSKESWMPQANIFYYGRPSNSCILTNDKHIIIEIEYKKIN